MAYKYTFMLKAGDDSSVELLGIDDRAKFNTAVAEKLIGCEYAELVIPVRLKRKYAFFIDEDGFKHELPLNYYASALYGTDDNRSPIVGNAVIVKLTADMDTDWLDETDVPIVQEMINEADKLFYEALKRMKEQSGMKMPPEESME